MCVFRRNRDVSDWMEKLHLIKIIESIFKKEQKENILIKEINNKRAKRFLLGNNLLFANWKVLNTQSNETHSYVNQYAVCVNRAVQFCIPLVESPRCFPRVLGLNSLNSRQLLGAQEGRRNFYDQLLNFMVSCWVISYLSKYFLPFFWFYAVITGPHPH